MLSDSATKSRFTLFSKLIVFIFVAVLAVVAVVGVGQFKTYQNLHDDWRVFQEEPEAKARLLNQILQAAGFGGFIHQFKNMVLRSETQGLDAMRRDLRSLQDAIDQYRGMNITSDERAALDTIERTFQKYRQALSTAIVVLRQGEIDAIRLDESVRVDETPALAAIKVLQQSRHTSHRIGTIRQNQNIAVGETYVIALLIIIPVLLAAGLSMFFLLRSTWGRVSDQMRQTASIVSNTAEGVITINRSGTIEVFNPAAETIFGYTADETIGQNVSMLLPESERQDHDGYVRDSNLYQSRIINQARDLFGRRKDGSLFPMELNVANLDTQDEERFVGIFRDISERKAAEREIRRRESRFRAFAATASDWLWETDKDHRFSWFSDNAISSRMNSLGKKRWELCDTSLDSQGWAHHQKLHIDRKPFDDFEYAIELPDGGQVWVSVSGTPYFDDDGEFLGYRGAARDITTRKENEHLIQLANERFQDFVDTASDWVWECDANLTFTHISDKFFELTAITPDQILGRTRWDYTDIAYSGRTQDVWDAHRKEMTAHKSFKDFRYKIPGVDGKPRTISLSGKACFDADGSFVGYRGTGTDMTYLTTVMESLEHARDEAEAANKAKSQFLSSMSHELRTPLNAVLGFGQLMDTPDNPLNEEQTESLKYIMDGGTHLLNLINEILDLAKIEAKKVSLSLETLPLDSIVGPSMVMASTLGEKYNVRVVNNISDDTLPPVTGDLTRTKQVLLNLLSNAVKYNTKGGLASLDAIATDDGMIRFSVSDTGPGIPESDLGELFTPFNRLANEGSEIEGTGIGLTITKELVEQMNGRIGVDSRVGEGSTFWFELPTAMKDDVREDPHDDLPSALSMAVTSAQILDLRQILYIEDNPANIELMKMTFKRAPNLTLNTAWSAEQGLEEVAAKKPDLILMDIDLPGMDGIEACKHLKADPTTNDIPVIAVSANAMPHSLEAADNVGFEAYIKKPFNVAELLEAVSAALEKADTRETSAPEDLGNEEEDKLLSVLDPTSVKRVQQSLAAMPDRYRSNLRNFLSSLPILQKKMVAAVEQGDFAALEMASHNFRSNTATLGAMDLSIMAMGIERMAQARELGSVKAIFNDIENEYRRVKPAMEKLIS